MLKVKLWLEIYCGTIEINFMDFQIELATISQAITISITNSSQNFQEQAGKTKQTNRKWLLLKIECLIDSKFCSFGFQTWIFTLQFSLSHSNARDCWDCTTTHAHKGNFSG